VEFCAPVIEESAKLKEKEKKRRKEQKSDGLLVEGSS